MLFHSNNKLNSKMTSSLTVTFSGKSSILQAKFMPEIILDAEYDYSCTLIDLIIKKASNLTQIIDLDVISIDCDLVSESYINGVHCHTIHQFVTSTSLVDSNNKTLIETPKHLNYLPVKSKHIQSIQISVRDSAGKPIKLDGGDIICHISIKRDHKKENK